MSHKEPNTPPVVAAMPGISRNVPPPIAPNKDPKEISDAFKRIDQGWAEGSREMKKRNAEAQRRFNIMVDEHPSFADPFWPRQRQLFFKMRDKQEAVDGPDGHWDATPQNQNELEILSSLEFLIDAAIKQFGARSMAIEKVLRSLPPGTSGYEKIQDRASLIQERCFLQILLKNRTKSVEEVSAWYAKTIRAVGLSDQRRATLEEHMQGLVRALSSGSPKPEYIVAPAEDADAEHSGIEIRNSNPGLTPPAGISELAPESDRRPFTIQTAEGGSSGIPLDFQDEDTEIRQQRSELHNRTKTFLDRVQSAQVFAERNILNNFDGSRENCILVLETLREVEYIAVNSLFDEIEHERDALLGDLTAEELRKVLIRENGVDSLADDVVAELAKLQTEASEFMSPVQELVTVKSRIVALQRWLNEHPLVESQHHLRIPVRRTVNVDENEQIPSHLSRLIEEVSVSGPKENERLTTQSAAEMLDIDLEIIQRKVAELHGSTGVEKIEKLIHDAGASALAGLDYENGDVTVQNRVQRIHSAQQLLIDEVWRRIKEKVRAQALADALAPKTIPSAEPTKPTEKTPAWHERAFTAVADTMTDLHDGAFDGAHRLLKPAIAVLFGTGVAAAGIALHEFAQNDSEEPRVSDPIAEHTPILDASTFDGENSVEGVDRDQDRDVGDAAPKIPTSVAAAEYGAKPVTTDHVVVKGDRIWDVVSDMIADRDLKVTDQKVGYLTHLALEENGITDHGVSLKIGSVLHLNSVDQALDEMEGKTVENVVASAPVDSQSLRDWYTPEASTLPIHDGRYTNPGFGYYGTENIAIAPSAEVGDVSVPHSEKAYSSIPTVKSPEHVMQKGEWIYKIIHTMLRENGLNWSTKRMTELKNKTLIENNLTEAQAMKIPVGTVITFADAAQDIEEMKAAKRKGK